MSPNAVALFEAAMALPAEDRVVLADRLMESVGQADLDAAWATEAEARVAAYQAGTLVAFPAEDVHRCLPDETPP